MGGRLREKKEMLRRWHEDGVGGDQKWRLCRVHGVQGDRPWRELLQELEKVMKDGKKEWKVHWAGFDDDHFLAGGGHPREVGLTDRWMVVCAWSEAFKSGLEEVVLGVEVEGEGGMVVKVE